MQVNNLNHKEIMEVDEEGEGFIVVKSDNEKSDEETIAEIEESLTDWIACRQDTIKKLREIATYIGKVQWYSQFEMHFCLFLLMQFLSLKKLLLYSTLLPRSLRRAPLQKPLVQVLELWLEASAL